MNRLPASENITADPGAYLLAIDLARRLKLDIATLSPLPLPAGRYVYCGSAYGPGGLRARIVRHLKADKPLHWHVDRLTLAGRIAQTAVLPGGSECDLMARLGALPGVAVPLPGFGSSDCSNCPAHLAAVPESFDIAEFISGFRSPA